MKNALFCLICALCVTAWAENSPPRVSVEVGLRNETLPGAWRPGVWTPIAVSIPVQNSIPRHFKGSARLEVPDSDGLPVVTQVPVEGELPLDFELCARFGHVESSFSLEILKEDGTTWFRTTAKPRTPAAAPARRMVLVVGGSRCGAEVAVEQLQLAAHVRPLVVWLPDADALPRQPRSWEWLDTIIVTTFDDRVLDSWTPDRIAALQTWTRHGGTLVFSLGKNAAKWAGNESWKPFSCGEFSENIPLTQTSALEQFAKSTIPVPVVGISAESKAPAAKFTHFIPDAQTSAFLFSDLPLVVRRSWEFGKITYFMLDLEHEALAVWPGRSRLVAALLEYSDRSADYDKAQVAGLHHGYDDMAGQLRSALDDFPGVSRISFMVLLAFFLVYLGILGPGCYFLCRKFPRAEAASWGIFALTVALGAFGMFEFSRTSGPSIRFNRVLLTDFQQGSGLVRQTVFGNVWSGETRRVTLRLAPISQDENTSEYVTWLGLSGPFLGGMESEFVLSSGTRSQADAYSEMSDVVSGTRLENIPMTARSTKSFCAARWREDAPLNFGTLREEADVPYGTVRNPLEVPLEQCVLFYGRWAYELGDLAPGQEVALDGSLPRVDVASVLVDVDVIEDVTTLASKKKDRSLRRVRRPYDQTSKNFDYILRTMLFYQAAGGRAYTGLNNDYQAWTDCTPLLHRSQAVLFGNVKPQESAGIFADLEIGTENESRLPTDSEFNRKTCLVRGFLPVR